MGRYAIFNGLVYGGGTAVIPNPEGTPTDELHSIQIDEDIYEIVGGGGSGEGYSETLLYKYESGTTVDGIKTLNDDITNYDLLLFRLVFNVPTYTDHIISVSALEQVGYIPNPVATGPHVSIVSYASDYIRIVEGETKNKINIFEINGNEYIDEIYGIKLEGGGGSGGGNASLDATTLYDTPITTTGTYTLADDYNNYDFIGFKAGNGSTETDIRLYAVKDIQDSMNDNLVITNNVTNAWFNFTINENELTIPGKTVSTIYSVIGYKIKGGGENSNVEANPAGTPTDTLSTIGIDGTIYNIEGSGGSGSSFVMDELYTGTSEVPSSGSTVSLSKSIDNYDFIMFDIGQNTEHTHQFFTPDTLNDSTNECLLFSTNGYCDVYASTSTELTFGNRNSFSSRQLYGVYGIKIGCGGGSSTNVQRLSPEAYNALPQSEKENGTIYFVHQDAGETTISGTFTTGSTQYEKVIVDCGFKPTSISVILPFSNGDTYAEYDEAISTTTSTWEIPMESRTYTITLGSETGESGITDILDNGFKFRCNASNTRNVNCTFEATGVLDNEINKIYYMGDEYTNGSSSDGSQELISYDTTITTTQYGWWTVEDKDGNVLDPDKYELIAVTPIVNNSPSWVGAWDGAFYINNIDGVTDRYDVTFVNINDGGYIRTSRTWDVKVIYRDKNAAGGGGGSTVVPNPQEEPTDTLNTIEIDGVVYDIEGGSEGGQGLNPANYSTEEEVIGVWTNNLPVYKKTWTFSSAITVASNSWADTSISVSDTQIHTIVNCEAVGPNGQAWTCISATTDEATLTYVRVLNTRNTDVNVKHLTLYYIKNGDSPIAPPGTDGIYNYYGGFIDTNNIIDSGTYTGTFTYTATEDCYINVALINNSNNDAQITIDGAIINYMWSTNGITNYQILPLKKGQTLVATSSAGNALDYTIYGITYSSSGGETSEGEGVEIYSEDEYIVGKWVDGKKLYQKTFIWNENITGSVSKSISLDNPDYAFIYSASGINSENALLPIPYTHSNSSNNIGVFISSTKDSIGFRLEQTLKKVIITIRYTKTVETPAPAWGGSVNNYYANFIDTNKIIDSGSYQGSFTYTATEDCFINIAVVMSANDSATITIDGALVTSGWCASLNTINPILPLKKGQTLVATASASNTSDYTVYGISYTSGGSESGSSKVEYSTNEHVVGTWIDGRDVYEKTIYYSSLQGRGSFLIDNTLISSDVDFFATQDVSYIVNNNYISGIGINLEVCINTQGVYLDNNNAPSGYPTNFTNMYITIRYVKKAAS